MPLSFSNIKQSISNAYNNSALGRSNDYKPKSFNEVKNEVSGTYNKALQTKANPSPLQPINTSYMTRADGQSPAYKSSPVQGPQKSATSSTSKPDYTGAFNAMTQKQGSGLILGAGSPTAYIPQTTTTQSSTAPKPTTVAPVTPPVKPVDPYRGAVDSLSNSQSTPYNQETQKSITTQQNFSKADSPALKSQTGLQGIADKQTPQVMQAQKEYADFSKASPFMLSDVRNNPNVASELSFGRGNAIGQVLSGMQGALAQNVSNALQGQGQQITAGQAAGQLGLSGREQQIGASQNAGALAQQGQGTLQSALGTAGQLAQPVAGASFFGSPTSGQLVGTGSGQGTGNQLIDSAVSNAVNMIKSGASSADAMATLSELGTPAQQAMINAMRQYDPNWNPTSSNAIAQQNMSQGMEAQQQAFDLDTGLKQLEVITPTILDFLQKSGLNDQENKFFNKSIKEYVGEFNNPANVQILNALQADVKKYTAQILGATGELNPTQIGEINSTFDPSDLEPEQLRVFLHNLDVLGKNQLSVLQSQSRQSYGGSQGYQGSTATPNTSLQTAKDNSPSMMNTDNPVIQGLLGGGKGFYKTVKGLANDFFN